MTVAIGIIQSLLIFLVPFLILRLRNTGAVRLPGRIGSCSKSVREVKGNNLVSASVFCTACLHDRSLP